MDHLSIHAADRDRPHESGALGKVGGFVMDTCTAVKEEFSEQVQSLLRSPKDRNHD